MNPHVRIVSTALLLVVFGGLLASGAIFLVMFVVILGPLMSEVVASHSPPMWDVIMYVPYLAIGLAALMKKQKAFGITLIITGLLAVVAFAGFLFGLQ